LRDTPGPDLCYLTSTKTTKVLNSVIAFPSTTGEFYAIIYSEVTSLYTVTAPTYNPSIVRTSFTPTAPPNFESGTIVLRSFIPTQTHSPDLRYQQESDEILQKRDTQLVSCTDLPEYGFATKLNSLTDVCQLVGNFQELFVPLAPTSASFMPTWLDYLVSTIVCIWQVVESVSNSASDQVRNTTTTLSASAWIWGIGGVVWGVVRTAFIILRILDHHQSDFAELPFISPVVCRVPKRDPIPSSILADPRSQSKCRSFLREKIARSLDTGIVNRRSRYQGSVPIPDCLFQDHLVPSEHKFRG
jgi:hypothetical protein